MTNKKTLIFDIDDTIFPLREKWASLIVEDDVLKQYPMIERLKTFKDKNAIGVVNFITDYKFETFFEIDKPEDIQRMLDIYINDASMYDDNDYIGFARAVRNYIRHYGHNANIVFLSHSLGGAVESSKIKYIERFMYHTLRGLPFDIKLTKSPEEKVTFLQENEWYMFCDDRLETVECLFESIISRKSDDELRGIKNVYKNKYICVPIYGYNFNKGRIDDLMVKSHLTNISIDFFHHLTHLYSTEDLIMTKEKFINLHKEIQ